MRTHIKIVYHLVLVWNRRDATYRKGIFEARDSARVATSRILLESGLTISISTPFACVVRVDEHVFAPIRAVT